MVDQASPGELEAGGVQSVHQNRVTVIAHIGAESDANPSMVLPSSHT